MYNLHIIIDTNVPNCRCKPTTKHSSRLPISFDSARAATLPQSTHFPRCRALPSEYQALIPQESLFLQHLDCDAGDKLMETPCELGIISSRLLHRTWHALLWMAQFQIFSCVRIGPTCAYPAKAASLLRIGQMSSTLSSGSTTDLADRHSCLTRSFQVACLACEAKSRWITRLPCHLPYPIATRQSAYQAHYAGIPQASPRNDQPGIKAAQKCRISSLLCPLFSACVISYYIVILRAIAFVLSFLYSRSFNRPS